jgi:hypothetical protein
VGPLRLSFRLVDSEDVLPKWDMVVADSNSNPESKFI